jgi:hypothetical protein
MIRMIGIGVDFSARDSVECMNNQKSKQAVGSAKYEPSVGNEMRWTRKSKQDGMVQESGSDRADPLPAGPPPCLLLRVRVARRRHAPVRVSTTASQPSQQVVTAKCLRVARDKGCRG